MNNEIERKIIVESGCFDEKWYLQEYPEVKKNADPIDDYITNWFSKNRNPNPFFENKHYLSQNPTFTKTKTPLAHYCIKGWREFKNPSKIFNTLWYMANHMPEQLYKDNPLKHFIQNNANKNQTSIKINDSKRLNVNHKIKFNTNCISVYNKIPENNTKAQEKIINELIEMHQYDVADALSDRLVSKNTNSIQAQLIRSEVLEKREKWKELKSTSEKIIELDSENINAYLTLGKSLLKLTKYSKANKAFKAAIRLRDPTPETYYLAALCQEKLNIKEASKNYSIAAKKSNIIPNKYTKSVLHAKYKNWIEAVKEYKKNEIHRESQTQPLKEYALALEYCFRWNEAEKIYNKISQNCDSESYRYGNILERLKKYDKAIEQYKIETKKRKDSNPLARYRLAFSLFKIQKYQEACNEWLKFATDSPFQKILYSETSPSWLNTASNKYWNEAKNLTKSDLKTIEKKLILACLHTSDHSPQLSISTGKILYKNKKYKEACYFLMEALQYKISYFNQQRLDPSDTKLIYKEHLETTEINQNLILYESAHGKRIGDNPYYMFLYLYKELPNFTHVWSIIDESKIPENLSEKENVIFVKEGSYNYLKYLASAKYLINSHTFKPFFTRRAEQLYLMTWHGTPMKKLGADHNREQLDWKNVSRNILQSTHLISPNAFTEKKLLEAYQVKEIYTGKTKITGYPRNDILFKKNSKETRKKLGIKNDLPIVLYAPTFRGDISTPTEDIKRLEDTLKEISSEHYNLIYSAHQFNKKKPECTSEKIIIAEEVEINSLLQEADALVTDYSSILFDYLSTNKPILLYPYDYKEYNENRGLYLQLEELDLEICKTGSEIKDSLEKGFKTKNWSKLPSPALIQKYASMDVGLSSQKACKFLFENNKKEKEEKNNKINILIYMGSFIPNGITTSFLNLMEAIDYEKYEITISLDPWTIGSYPQRIEKLLQLPKKINILPRVSYPVANVDEIHINKFYQKNHGNVSRFAIKEMENLYKNEFYRLYGESKFDIIIDFNGYDFFWTALFAFNKKPTTKSIVWLHSDMHSEMTTRFSHLKNSLCLINRFNRLISVSETSHEENIKSLATNYKIEKNKFFTVQNIFIPNLVIKRSNDTAPNEIVSLQKNNRLIGTVARLSYEKGIDRLITAFKKINDEFKDTKLIIVGQGPEKNNLLNLTKELNLESSIIFLGYLENPYPVMKNLDIFVLPSRYEGQGIAILEALALNIPIVSTKIPGPVDILSNTNHHLAQSSEEGIYKGIKKLLTTRIDSSYDFNSYILKTNEQLANALRVE